MNKSHLSQPLLARCPDIPMQLSTASLVLAIVLTPLIACTSCTLQAGDESDRVKLKAIAKAICDHREMWGEFPPPAIFDAEGKPLHSWRVLIVPYLEKNWFADQYRMDEPWNGGHNKSLLETRIEGSGENRHDVAGVRHWFVCTNGSSTRMKYATCFVMVVDRHDPSEPLKYWPDVGNTPGWQQNKALGDVPIVVALSKSKSHWMEPRDFTLEDIVHLLIESSDANATQVNGAAVISADGNVRVLDNDAALQRLENMVATAKERSSREKSGEEPE